MKKNIWIINHYAGEQFVSMGGRHYNFSQCLKEKGYSPVVFCSNARHNSNMELFIDSRALYEVVEEDSIGVPFIFVKSKAYSTNGLQRILNMVDFYRNVQRSAIEYAELNCPPDLIIASSVHPLSVVAGIKLARHFRTKCICEIRDLWPESIIAYGIASPKNPLVVLLRHLEKWIYKKADRVVFTMSGGYDYIKDQGWEKEIPKEKVEFINNGVDIKQFDYNKQHFSFPDEDLDDENTYKVVYTGSLRRANSQIKPLFDAIEMMQGDEFEDYRFLIYGKGELEDELRKECEAKGFTNVRIKGFVDKKYIPYILSKCDVNILNCAYHEILRYGGSQNKLFDYLASGNPIITGDVSKYSIVLNEQCGFAKDFKDGKEVAEAIQQLREAHLSKDHIRAVGEKYDFLALTRKLLDVIESI